MKAAVSIAVHAASSKEAVSQHIRGSMAAGGVSGCWRSEWLLAEPRAARKSSHVLIGYRTLQGLSAAFCDEVHTAHSKVPSCQLQLQEKLMCRLCTSGKHHAFFQHNMCACSPCSSICRACHALCVALFDSCPITCVVCLPSYLSHHRQTVLYALHPCALRFALQ